MINFVFSGTAEDLEDFLRQLRESVYKYEPRNVPVPFGTELDATKCAELKFDLPEEAEELFKANPPKKDFSNLFLSQHSDGVVPNSNETDEDIKDRRRTDET